MKVREVHKRTAYVQRTYVKITDGALKGVTSFTIPEEKAAYTLFNPDRKIDCYLSIIGMYKRMSLDVFKVGGVSKILIEKKRLLKEKYHDKIKAELKKKK